MIVDICTEAEVRLYERLRCCCWLHSREIHVEWQHWTESRVEREQIVVSAQWSQGRKLSHTTNISSHMISMRDCTQTRNRIRTRIAVGAHVIVIDISIAR